MRDCKVNLDPAGPLWPLVMVNTVFLLMLNLNPTSWYNRLAATSSSARF
jgi:hypothetical protein